MNPTRFRVFPLCLSLVLAACPQLVDARRKKGKKPRLSNCDGKSGLSKEGIKLVLILTLLFGPMFLYTLVLWLRQLYRRRYPHGWWSRRPYFWHAGPTLDEVAAAGRAAAEAETLEYEMKMATEGGRTRAKGQHTTATSTSASHGEKPTAVATPDPDIEKGSSSGMLVVDGKDLPNR